MRRKIGIGILILTILLIRVVSISGASLNISQDTPSKGKIFEFNDSNSVRMPLPNFGPQTFKDLKNNPDVLATRGQMPQFFTQTKRRNCLSKLDEIRVLNE